MLNSIQGRGIDFVIIDDCAAWVADEDNYGKYRKDISHLDVLDVYRVLDLFNVTDHAIGHAIKKLLMAGDRTGGKTAVEDLQEAVDTLNRKIAMMDEDRYLCTASTTTVDGAMLRRTQTLTPEQVLVHSPEPAKGEDLSVDSLLDLMVAYTKKPTPVLGPI